MPDIDYSLWVDWLDGMLAVFRDKHPEEADLPIPFGLFILAGLAANRTERTEAVFASIDDVRRVRTAKEAVH